MLQGPLTVDSLIVYVIDKSLTPLQLRPITARQAIEVVGQRTVRAAIRPARRAGKIVMSLLRGNRRAFEIVRRFHERLHALPPMPAVGSADTQHSASFRRALAERSLAALHDLYAMYQDKVLCGSGIKSAPAERLAAYAAPADGLSSLRNAVVAAPQLSEAWLELGYACVDAGDDDGAVTAFDRARSNEPTLPLHRGEADPRVLATMGLADILIKRGRSEEALCVLDAVVSLPPVPWRCHLTRGQLLLQLGRCREAMSAFEASLPIDHIMPRMTELPATLVSLRERLRGAAPQTGSGERLTAGAHAD